MTSQPRPQAPFDAIEVLAHDDGPTNLATYEDAIRYLNRHVNFERTRPSRIQRTELKLDRMRALLEALGNPQHGVRFVHVAGSKGKGSVVEMVAAAMAGCGSTVGVYTSPHLVHERERVRINDECISPEQFTVTMARVAEASRIIHGVYGVPTYFEVMTAIALAFFAEMAVDLAVLETGLGGRLDSTNVVTPEVTAITSIQLEHTQILGNTLEEIAAEKAGIFKAGVPALTIPQPAPVKDVLRRSAMDAGTELRVLGEGIEFSSRFEADAARGPHARVSLATGRAAFEHVPVPLKGEHQAWNCGLALAIIDELMARGYRTTEHDICRGLDRTIPGGRMERILSSPAVIIDGAHTPDSIHSLIKALGAHYRFDSVVFVFGCAADKDVDGMLRRLSHGADKVIFTRTDNPRAADPADLLKRFQEISNKMAQAAADLPSALKIAGSAVGADDVICVTGSFYLAGEAKRYIAERQARKAGA